MIVVPLELVMSWSNILPTAKNGRVFSAFLLALSVGGCFQPLYGEAAHPGLTADLQAISIDPIEARIGHYLGDDLSANLNGTGSIPEPKYRLIIKVSEGSNTPTVTSQLGLANAATLTATAVFTLKRAGGGETLFTSQANAAAVYDRTEDRFANLRALRDGDIRLAKSLADEIELRLAAFLGDKK
jgi:LPS-assembly lipoprotein